ncbi:hypothetical protein EXIGLDRAFT_847834 [Exidia glandulosa HHB12029]|uniref:Extracellular membrane protein CFEM domain-containing protein n=1 Tax=Exidia glandulosa HHB12029 TaxID=1314781 RepID=A0A166MIA3_EXIGL|nr:hypothetical protein EXIGLDRAFT_847834 [Exidia glandulosa HHB12029]
MRVSALFVLVITASVASAQSTSNGTTGSDACLEQCSKLVVQNSTSAVAAKFTQCYKAASGSAEAQVKCVCDSDLATPLDSCFQQNCPDDKAKLDAACKAVGGSASSLSIGSAGLLLAGLLLL